MSSSIPPFDPSSLTLRVASPAERNTTWQVNSASWAGKLSVEDYIGRENLNGNQELTRDGQQRYWIYTGPGPEPRDGEKQETEVIHASVETLKKPVAIKTSDGRFSIESSYGIASVYTMTPYRGKKVASSMMNKLGKWFDSEEANCQLSVLYSDVGEYYSPLGWPTFSNLETSLPPNRQSLPPNIQPLDRKTLPDLCVRDVASLTENIRTTPLSSGLDARLAFLPTFAQAAWHFGAEEYMASKLHLSASPSPSPSAPPTTVSDPSPARKGAITTTGDTAGYWVHNFNENHLIFLRVVSFHPPGGDDDIAVSEIANIIRVAQDEAAAWSLKRVVIWNPDERTVAACKLVLGEGKEVDVYPRTEGSIPCLRWKGGEEVLGADGRFKVDWVASEKFNWC